MLPFIIKVYITLVNSCKKSFKMFYFIIKKINKNVEKYQIFKTTGKMFELNF